MKSTEKLGLKKPDLTDYVNIGDLNDNMDVLDETVGELKEGSTVIEELGTENKTLSGAINEIKTEVDEHKTDSTSHGIGNKTTLLTTNKSTIVGAMNELFTNVSNGKQLVGGAITGVDDSIVIPTDPTFGDLVDAITRISTGYEVVSGTAITNDAKRLIIAGLSKSPILVVGESTGSIFTWWDRGGAINHAASYASSIFESGSLDYLYTTSAKSFSLGSTKNVFYTKSAYDFVAIFNN